MRGSGESRIMVEEVRKLQEGKCSPGGDEEGSTGLETWHNVKGMLSERMVQRDKTMDYRGETYGIWARKLSWGPTRHLDCQAVEDASSEQLRQKCALRYLWWQNTR